MPVATFRSRIHLNPTTEEQFSISVILNGKQRVVWPIHPTPLPTELVRPSVTAGSSLTHSNAHQFIFIAVVVFPTNVFVSCFLLYLFVFKLNFGSNVSFLGIFLFVLTVIVFLLSLLIFINSADYRGSEVGYWYLFFAWFTLLFSAYILLAAFSFALPQRFKSLRLYSWWEILGLGAIFALAQMMISIFLNARYFPFLNSQASLPLFVLNVASLPVVSILLTAWLIRQRGRTRKS